MTTKVAMQKGRRPSRLSLCLSRRLWTLLLAFTLTVMESPAIWIREERTRLGLSTRDLARLSGVSYPTISKIEKGHEQPRWSTLEKIFKVLGRSVTTSRMERSQPRLADLTTAWSEDATHAHHPDWVRVRAFADELRLRPYLTAQAIFPEPPQSQSPLIDTLLAAIAEKLADDAGIARPRWTRKRLPLREPWSVAARPSKQSEVEATTPVQFRKRGLLIPASTIWRERKLELA